MFRASYSLILFLSFQAFAKVPDISQMRGSVLQAAQVIQSQEEFSARMDSLTSLKMILIEQNDNNSDSTMEAHRARNYYYALLPVLQIEKEKDCQTVANQVTQGKVPQKDSNEDFAMRLLAALCN